MEPGRGAREIYRRDGRRGPDRGPTRRGSFSYPSQSSGAGCSSVGLVHSHRRTGPGDTRRGSGGWGRAVPTRLRPDGRPSAVWTGLGPVVPTREGERREKGQEGYWNPLRVSRGRRGKDRHPTASALLLPQGDRQHPREVVTSAPDDHHHDRGTPVTRTLNWSDGKSQSRFDPLPPRRSAPRTHPPRARTGAGDGGRVGEGWSDKLRETHPDSPV